MIRYLNICILCFFTVLNGCAQTKNTRTSKELTEADKWFKEAIKESRNRQINKAHQLYDKIIKNYPEYIDAYLMKGGLLYTSNNFDEARIYFSKAIELDPDYNPEVYYSMALLENHEKNYRMAADHMATYLTMIGEDHRKYEKAHHLQSQYLFKAEAVSNPRNIEKEALPFPINTDNSEYLPLFTADGEQMIFVRRTNQQEDLYLSQYIDNEFTMPTLIEEISTLENEGVHSISADGRTLVFTGCNRRDSYGSCDLYFTKRKPDGTWSKPSNMGKLVNSVSWDGQPALSADGKTLYFSSTRAGGIGGRDIWVTKKDITGRWEIPKNLSGAINTLNNDETPFIHADGKTLYFRSDGRLGMGGFDLYWSRYDNEYKEWSVPENLGYPINTEADEGGLTIDLNGEMAYYSSNENGKDVDIYRFNLPPDLKPNKVTFLKGKIIDSETGEKLMAKISIVAYNEDVENIIESDLNGTFLYPLPLGESYGITIEKDGYLFYSDFIGLDSIYSVLDPFVKSFMLIPTPKIKKESIPVVLNNIFFESGSATLKAASMQEISRLQTLLEENPGWKILITGHTDNIGTEEDNAILSENRAKAVVEALVIGGINPDRLFYEGKGEIEPIDSNDTPEGRQRNRRTEFKIM